MNSILKIKNKTIQSIQKIQRFLDLKKINTRLDFQVWSIFTHTTEEERIFLYKISSQLSNYSNIVEIGSYLGAST
ncbi:MAG: hypothetical protein ACKPFK_20635, partial [Dolichospermum sp.]